MAKEEKTLSEEDRKRIEQEAKLSIKDDINVFFANYEQRVFLEAYFQRGAEYEHKYQREQNKALFEGQAIAWEDKVKDKNEQIEQLKIEKRGHDKATQSLTKSYNALDDYQHKLMAENKSLTEQVEKLKEQEFCPDFLIEAYGLKTRVWTFHKTIGKYGCAECCTGDRCDEDCKAKYRGRRDECPHCKGSGWIPKAEARVIPIEETLSDLSRLRDRVEKLQSENDELKNEIKTLSKFDER